MSVRTQSREGDSPDRPVVTPGPQDDAVDGRSRSRGKILPRFDVQRLQRHLPEISRIRIEVNGVLAGAPFAVPDAVVEFAIGWAFVNRFFDTADQVSKTSSSSSHVSLMVQSGADLDRLKYEAIGWIPRSELDETTGNSDRSTRTPRAVSVMTELDAISTCQRSFAAFEDDGAKAGYVHVALATIDEVLCVARDVGTGAAAEKVLGWALRNDTDRTSSMLVVRGILHDRIVEAASRAGIPVVATDAVPTASAIAVAQASCTTIVGLALSHRRGVFADGGHLGDDSMTDLPEAVAAQEA